MNERHFWTRFVVAVLGTWRVTHLLANEDGPADLVVRLRARLGRGLVGRLMDCFQCLSLWVAAPFSFFVARRSVERLLTWLALSGAACLLERIGRETVVRYQLDKVAEGDANDGMLRSATSSDQERNITGDSGGSQTART